MPQKRVRKQPPLRLMPLDTSFLMSIYMPKLLSNNLSTATAIPEVQRVEAPRVILELGETAKFSHTLHEVKLHPSTVVCTAVCPHKKAKQRSPPHS